MHLCDYDDSIECSSNFISNYAVLLDQLPAARTIKLFTNTPSNLTLMASFEAICTTKIKLIMYARRQLQPAI